MFRTGPTMWRVPELLWWIGGFVATALVVLGTCDNNRLRVPPETPFDGTRSGHAEMWKFLDEASNLIPAGATVTIDAPDPDTRMRLFMMAVGLIPEATVIPRTYYGRSVAASSGARFVLTFGTGAGERNDPGRSVGVPGGSVTDRRPSHP
jgi:hypothetical protein